MFGFGGLSLQGRNYTLSFGTKLGSDAPGPLSSSPATPLLSGNGSLPSVMFVTGGNSYVLNYTLPVNVWSFANVIVLGKATYFAVTEQGKKEEVHEFTATIRTVSSAYIWNNPMSIEAPFQTIGGGGFEGYLGTVEL